MNKVGRRKFCLLKLISAAQKKRNPLKISFVVDVGGIHIQVLGHVEYMLLKLHLLATPKVVAAPTAAAGKAYLKTRGERKVAKLSFLAQAPPHPHPNPPPEL